ncbi:hypothetical protein PLICRDRAFT_108304 [Plicaturopsis crispa FD-325 SS-3]|nr:hypothetical protein PLICRDRAFT_108304 [Plicaturopsis crispa FD-325 SS-3]
MGYRYKRTDPYFKVWRDRNVLSETDISLEEYQKWIPVMTARDIDYALLVLIDMGFPIPSWDTGSSLSDQVSLLEGRQPPTWLVLYIITHKVRTSSQAAHALPALVYSHFPSAPSHLQPSILVFTTLVLSIFRAMQPLPDIIRTFLCIPLPEPVLYFNLILVAIGRFTQSKEAADLVVPLLEAMRSRQIHLRASTYEILLADRFVTMQLTKHLRAQMLYEGYAPKASHLEAYLRVFAKDGAIHDAGRYLGAVRAQVQEDVSDGASTVASGPSAASSVHTAHTHFLGAFKGDRASAFDYLGRLLRTEQAHPHAHPESPLSSRRASIARTKKSPLNIYDWTTTLAAAARDKRTSSRQLIRLLQQVRNTTRTFRPTVATYTVVLRGLIYRKDLEGAETIWRQLREDGLPLDDKGLTVGLQVLTRIGKPHLAFILLELLAIKPGETVDIARRRSNNRPVAPDTMMLNEFMVSLLRIRRPDIVFKLWDHMETLYDVRPNAVTLDILLKSANVASKLDNTLRGLWAEFVSHNPFRHDQPELSDRDQIVDSITVALGDMDGGPVPYRSGMWRNAPAWRGARKVFQQVLLGNRPDMRRIASPANAVRKSRDSPTDSPMSEIAQGISSAWSSGVYKNTVVLVPPSPLYAGAEGIYPEIVLNDQTFFSYISLLGLHSQAAEIPLALAWMRALGVSPAQSTLAMALVFWGEVSLQAPLIESWAGGRASSEYEKLVQWIRDWVGDDRVPKDHHIGHWLRQVKKMRRPMDVNG